MAALVASVAPARQADPGAVRRHLDALTKPPGSLGRLEELAVRVACVYGDPPPPLRRRLVVILAGDHGVVARGVSAYPAAVTPLMCGGIAAGRAAVSALAGAAGAVVRVADLGVATPVEAPGVEDRNVRRGTGDLAVEPALTRSESLAGILEGAALLDREDPDLVALGEMGIGNTTPSAALAAALTGAPVEAVVGPGTGLGSEGMSRKREVVAAGLARIGHPRHDLDPVGLLAEVGGAELAGLVGVILAAAARSRMVVLDGFITTAAAAVAVALCPAVGDYLVAGHRSAEPGHPVLLEWLGLEPLLELDLRLGEGTGATLALPIVDAAGSILREMATFQDAGIPEAVE